MEVRTGKVQVIAGAITVGNVQATSACVLLENVPQVRHGFAHGQNIQGMHAIYAREVTFLHAQRTLREWLAHINQQLIQNITIDAGDGSLCHIIKQWFTTGDCKLESAVVAGIIRELQTKADWTKAKMSIWPLHLPETFEDLVNESTPIHAPPSMAERFRMVILQPRGTKWSNPGN